MLSQNPPSESAIANAKELLAIIWRQTSYRLESAHRTTKT
jgi:hypothetical protein